MASLLPRRRLSDAKRGIAYEKRQASEHRATHLGGPGKPDYKRGQTLGEVKNWSRPVGIAVIREARVKAETEIISRSGFTKPAIQEAKVQGIKLLQGQKVVVERAPKPKSSVTPKAMPRVAKVSPLRAPRPTPRIATPRSYGTPKARAR